MNTFVIIIATVILLMVIYLVILRPQHLKWGAFKNQINQSLPGDELVLNPDFNATRAITINASPNSIWPWIIQIGSGRAGWYSIDWIDNGGVKSSNMILNEFQKIENGMFIPFTPDQKKGRWVREFEVNKFILWEDKKNKASWLWYLNEQSDGTTRLITRLRTKYEWNNLWLIYYLIYDFGDIIMMKKCMKGIKERSENAF